MQKKIKNNIEVILFDLDGTFVDTSKDMCHALNIILKDNNFDSVTHEELKYHISKGADGIIQFGFKNSIDQIKKNQLKEDFLSIYQNSICVHTHLVDGMKELVESIELKKITWGIVTNKHARFTKTILDQLGYLRRVDCLVTGDMVKKNKPDPDCLMLASRELNKDPKNIIYVGDDRRDIVAGKAAGMVTVVADFGFVLDNSVIPSWNPDYIIKEPRQLLDIINYQ